MPTLQVAATAKYALCACVSRSLGAQPVQQRSLPLAAHPCNVLQVGNHDTLTAAGGIYAAMVEQQSLAVEGEGDDGGAAGIDSDDCSKKSTDCEGSSDQGSGRLSGAVQDSQGCSGEASSPPAHRGPGEADGIVAAGVQPAEAQQQQQDVRPHKDPGRGVVVGDVGGAAALSHKAAACEGCSQEPCHHQLAEALGVWQQQQQQALGRPDSEAKPAAAFCGAAAAAGPTGALWRTASCCGIQAPLSPYASGALVLLDSLASASGS
jgi:hypothetical protein